MCLSSSMSIILPRRFLATTIPFSSTRKLLGIAPTPYIFAASDFHFFKSLAWYFQDRLSFLMAPFQACKLASKETLKTSNPFALLNFAWLYFSYARTTFGFSLRHGTHQEAQKSIRTSFRYERLVPDFCADFPGYVLTPKDHTFYNLYGDHVQENDEIKINGGILGDKL